MHHAPYFTVDLLSPAYSQHIEQVISVAVQSVTGALELLAHHMPLTTVLESGMVRVTCDNGLGEQVVHQYYAIDGMLHHEANHTTITARMMVPESDIASIKAQSALSPYGEAICALLPASK